MTWLSEIQENQKCEYKFPTSIGSHYTDLRLAIEDGERMARVLREQVRYIRILESTDDPKERLHAFEDICSDDAKELLG